MLTVVEVVMLVGLFIVPLLTPKKKYNRSVEPNTSHSQYAISEDGAIVKL